MIILDFMENFRPSRGVLSSRDLAVENAVNAKLSLCVAEFTESDKVIPCAPSQRRDSSDGFHRVAVQIDEPDSDATTDPDGDSFEEFSRYWCGWIGETGAVRIIRGAVKASTLLHSLLLGLFRWQLKPACNNSWNRYIFVQCFPAQRKSV